MGGTNEDERRQETRTNDAPGCEGKGSEKRGGGEMNRDVSGANNVSKVSDSVADEVLRI